MINRKKQDAFAILFYLIVFSLVYLILVNQQYIYGSAMDFQTQHYLLPEYFRALFYQTGNLLSDFAPHLGAGQNIYYFSYYGFLNPVILFSYLLPSVKMLDYIIVTNCLTVVTSATLFYFFLKKHGYSFKVCFVTGFLFLCATPIIFHSHRHIMFINYMPFLLMAFFGMDRLFEKGKSALLVLGAFLMIMTSYYFSVGGLIALFIYGLYLYRKNTEKIRQKELLVTIFRMGIPLGLAVIMAAVILLPTLYALILGRPEGASSSINLWHLLNPATSFKFLLYGSYGPGLCAVALVGLATMIFSPKKEIMFLAITSLVLITFPLFNYILNGTLYINAKTLIPFLPLFLLVTAEFFKVLFQNELKTKYILLSICILLPFIRNLFIFATVGLCICLLLLLHHSQKKYLFALYAMIFAFVVCLAVNTSDQLMPKESLTNEDYTNDITAVNAITNADKGNYRINNFALNKQGLNHIINNNQYQNTAYSSTSNKYFATFCYDIMNNEIPFRNRSMISYTNNPLFHILMGEKYFISKGNAPIGYEPISQNGNLITYKNNQVFPLGYASSSLLNEEEFTGMEYPYNVVNLFSHIVVKEKTSTTQKIQPSQIFPTYQMLEKVNLEIHEAEDSVQLQAGEFNRLILKLNIPMDRKVLFIRFENEGHPFIDTAITINDTKNKLTAKNWKYYNNNSTFDYIISNTDILDISFAKGKYALKDFRFYIIDYDDLISQRSQIDPLEIDKEASIGNVLKGTITPRADGYFVASIPYDKGFKILVDGKEAAYERTNTSFIGFPITQGSHEIFIEYHAPYKTLGLIISIIGFALFGLLILTEHLMAKRKQQKLP